jgi:hypothetical protein
VGQIGTFLWPKATLGLEFQCRVRFALFSPLGNLIALADYRSGV